MKKTNKYLYILIIGILLILSIVIYTQRESKINCNEFSVIYLTHDELKYASSIANKLNGVVVIPEDKQMIARTDILECDNPYFKNELNKVINSLN
jgi:hypothetical protein